MSATPSVGSILEIPVTGGFRYAILTHEHKRMGSLVRVFVQRFSDRAAFSLASAVASGTLFVCFVPAKAIVEQGVLSVIAVVEVPPEMRPFPLFRMGVVDPRSNKVREWWLWDGEKEWIVGKLKSEQRKLPIRGIWNDTLLKERADSGWTVADDTR